MDETIRNVGAAALVLVSLLAIFGIILVGFRRRGHHTPLAASRAHQGRWGALTFAEGITATVAVLGISASFGASSSASWIGLFGGMIVAVLVMMWSGGGGKLSRIIVGAGQAVIGVAATILATTHYFRVATSTATSCGSDVVLPLWYSIAVYLLLLLALAWAVVRSVWNSGKLIFNLDADFCAPLAVFAALEVAIFFMRPFGLSLDELNGAQVAVPFIGVLVVIVGCYLSPKTITIGGGIALALSSVVYGPVVSADCSPVDPQSASAVLFYVIGFGVVWILVKKIVIDAVLHRRS